MAVVVASGTSTDVDEAAAARHALTQARAQLHVPPTGALLYVTGSYDAQAVLEHVHESLGDVPLIGCTTSGLVTGRGGHESDGVLVVLLGGDVRCAATIGRGLRADPFEVARAAAVDAIAAVPDARLLLVHPDSIRVDGAAVVRGVQEGAPGVTIAGGTSAEFTGRRGTYQFYGREILRSTVPIMAIGGDIQLSTGRGCGWKPVGRRYEVTGIEGRTLLEVDGRPVLDIFHEYSADTGLESLADTPLAVFEEPDATEFYLRVVERVDTATGGLVLVTAVPRGAQLQFTEASPNDVLRGAEESAASAVRTYPGSRPKAAFMFSCTARKWLLASRVAEESGSHAGQLTGPAADVPLFGFYAHGEIGPLEAGGPALHHNQTCVTLLLGN